MVILATIDIQLARIIPNAPKLTKETEAKLHIKIQITYK